MSQEETVSLPTVLDYLNEDCWREVLQYVPLKDIILSERVSKRWQRVVLVYLQKIRIHVYEPNIDDEISQDACPLPLWEVYWWSFKEWVKKLGPIVVGACCSTVESFQIIGENCPYLEQITFYELISGDTLQIIGYECFNRLRRVYFKSCQVQITEECLGPLVASPNLEVLEIEFDARQGKLWRGFLTNIKSNNLKSFILKDTDDSRIMLKYTSNSFILKYRPLLCRDEGLNFGCFLAAADRFSAVTKFEADTMEDDIAENLHLLVDKMPKLEHLKVFSYTQDCDNIFKSVAKLRNLKYLDVDYYVCDRDLKMLARSCPRLRVLKFGYCIGVTGEGLQALCSLRLKELALQSMRYEMEITDDEVVDFIRSCPSLKGHYEGLILEFSPW